MKKRSDKTIMQMLDALMEEIPRTEIDLSKDPVPVQTTIEVPTDYDEKDRKAKKKTGK